MFKMSYSSPGSSVSSTPVYPAITSEHIRGLPAHPFLPFEIWEMILQMIWDDFWNGKSQDDLTHLWTCVRPVCKQLKAEVEDIVIKQHLPKTVLHFITGQYSLSCLCLPTAATESIYYRCLLISCSKVARYISMRKVACQPLSIIYSELPGVQRQ